MIGCGGAGKTTLANALGHRLAAPVIHVDGHYWHGDDRGASSYAEWRRLHAELVAGDRWVIDGMKLGTLDARLAAADTVVFLDLPTHSCLGGVLRRRLRQRGRSRPDEGLYDVVSMAFVRWIWSFRRSVRPLILAKLDECSCDVVVLRSRREARAFLESLSRSEMTPSAGVSVRGMRPEGFEPSTRGLEVRRSVP